MWASPVYLLTTASRLGDGSRAPHLQVAHDHLEWKLGRVVGVGDAGLCSKENRRHLQRAGGGATS
ncbi:MAG: hypothetical protein M0T72_07145 [Candidatus Dormibacteraeota bacterium]|nr:hypothetical protein [Candidatus Dormibacteraeota bacterium]